MIRWKRVLAAALLLAGAAGCADVVGIEGEGDVASPSPRMDVAAESGGGDPLPEWPVVIHSTSARLDAVTESLEANMYYDGYHASIGGTITVMDDRGSTTLPFHPQEKHVFTPFRNNFHQVQIPVPIMASCGTRVIADLQFRAWWKGTPGGDWAILQEQNASRTVHYRQEACPTRDVEEAQPRSGGGLEQQEDNRAYNYTACVVRYTYDLDTGEILSSKVLYCY